MNVPIIIGITGGIGSGKSTLSKRLRAHGFDVYDTDKEAHRLQNHHPRIKTQLMDLFGPDIYTQCGLNRKEIGKVVFENKELLDRLTHIIHPVVEEDFRQWVNDRFSHDFLFIESAILFESGLNYFVDKVIVVTASEEVRIRRVLKRDGISLEQVHARMKNQLPEEAKIEKADYVIYSDDEIPPDDKANNLIIKIKSLKK